MQITKNQSGRAHLKKKILEFWSFGLSLLIQEIHFKYKIYYLELGLSSQPKNTQIFITVDLLQLLPIPALNWNIHDSSVLCQPLFLNNIEHVFEYFRRTDLIKKFIFSYILFLVSLIDRPSLKVQDLIFLFWSLSESFDL